MKLDAKQIKNHFIHLRGTGTRTLTTTYSTANLTTIIADSGTVFTQAGGVVTYTGEGGFVEVTYTATGDSGNNTRSVMKSLLAKNNTNDISTERFSYHRQTADGEGSVAYTGIFPIATNDNFRILNAEVTTGDNVVQSLEKTSLQIKLI